MPLNLIRSNIINLPFLVSLPFLLILLPVAVFSQGGEDNDDLQSWNDLELTIPVNEQFDIKAAGTLRLEQNFSKPESYRFVIGVEYKPFKNLSLTPFQTFISSRRSSGRYRYEYRTGLDVKYAFPVKGFSLSHRSRFEHRSRPGRNSWRYRPSIKIERDLPESFLTNASVFIKDEPFYDSVSGTFSRNRISTGIEKTVNKNFALEVFYTFEGDNVSTPGSVHVLGTEWKLRL
ncbi:MAG: DUF2490 domain-containing protein [Pyrinomonadaceae bacterium]